MRAPTRFFAYVFLCGLVACASCKREERGFRVEPPASSRTQTARMSELQPGATGAASPQTQANGAAHVVKTEYEGNAFALSEGKRLYEWYNCVGCHAHGGGGMGPALLDDKWIYGGQPEQIFSTIVEGRPNGMPSFRGRIPDYQVWQLAAYVRSLSGQVPKDAAPGRNDDMQAQPPEHSREREEMKSSGVPKSAEMPQ